MATTYQSLGPDTARIIDSEANASIHSSRDDRSRSVGIKGASPNSVIINLLNTIIGAGILATPFAIRQDGILLGSLLIILAGSLAGLGLYFQGLCATFVPASKASFFQVAQITYPSLSVVFDLAIAIKCFGVGVSYLIIIADLMPQISDYFGFTNNYVTSRVFWVLLAMYVLMV